MRRLLEITVCPLEPGSVALPLERGGRPRRMDARAIRQHLERLIRRRALAGRVWLREDCAGGCHRAGPNVNVDVFLKAPPGAEQDHVAVENRSYVYSLASLPCLARIIDENLRPGRPRGTRAARSGRRRRPPPC
ncbi:MAG: hypothetical protein HYY64_10845 [Candidatus Rokubacteria bacterium]|nr:hypothetical protein [Candidatus Rokubacteria bacterium]